MGRSAVIRPVERVSADSGKPCGDIIPVSPRPWKRLIAGAIDGVIAAGIGLAAGGVVLFIDRQAHVALLVGAFAAAIYVLFRDGLRLPVMDYRSFGKWVMRLRPVHQGGICVDLARSALRNCSLAITPAGWALLLVMSLGVTISFILAAAVTVLVIVEVFFVLLHPDGRRLGDRLAGTTVLPTASARHT